MNVRDRNKPTGSIGPATRRSTMTSAMSDTTPQPMIASSSRRLALASGHSRSPKTTLPRPTMARPAPIQSMRDARDVSRLSVMNRADSATTIAASGTFSTNTARQPTCSINHPPATGPMADIMALKADHVPIARPRSASSKVALIIARLPGTRNAAPTPCAARAAMSARVEPARPHAIDAMVNRIVPARNVRFRPNWSPMEPPTRINPPRNNAYASITHWTSVMVACRSA